ncbi:hypothetical protein ACFWUQ_05840 [Streptomyces sp. NPDC058662]|uniref:hypothetical protein n=1 Tax=Streptomyces sp. NPDC058662 TaxID=3346583 RepID=UPI00364E7BF0
MHHDRRRRRERRSVFRVGTAVPVREVPTPVVAGTVVLLAGYFSGKQKDAGALMDAAAADLAARGARVAARVVQRRGVSDGGVRKMSLPFSSRTLMRSGKVREAAGIRERTGAGAVVLLTPLTVLTERQRQVLSVAFDCPVLSLREALGAA